MPEYYYLDGDEWLIGYEPAASDTDDDDGPDIDIGEPTEPPSTEPCHE